MFVQSQPNVFDADPTLYNCYINVLCLPGWGQIIQNKVTKKRDKKYLA